MNLRKAKSDYESVPNCGNLKIKKHYSEQAWKGVFLGRPRKPDEEKKTTIFIRLPNPILRKIEKEGEPRRVIEELLKKIFSDKD